MVRESAGPEKMAFKKHGVKMVLGIIISLIFLGLALYNINFTKLAHTFRQINIRWLLLSGIFILVANYFRSLLWYQLLRRHSQPHIWDFFRIITIGYFVNNILPFRLGEVVRAWLLGKRERLSTSLAVATVVLERGMDLLVLLFYFILMMFIIPFENWLKLSGLILAAIGLGFFLMVVLNYRFGGHLLDFIEKPLQRLPGNIGFWLHSQINKFLEGLKLVESPGHFFAAFGLSHLSWMAWVMVTYFCFRAVGLDLPFFAAGFLIVVLNFGLMLPSSPGGLGVFEFMVIIALTKYGVEKEIALGFGFVYHMLQYLLILVLGWIFAIQMNVSMLRVSQTSVDMETGHDNISS